MNVLTFPFWKVFSHLSCPLCHMYYSLICDTSSPYSTFLACTLSFIRSNSFLQSMIGLALPAIFTPSGLWNHNLTSHCPPPPLCPHQRSLCATHVRHWNCLLVSFPKLQRSQKFHREAETVWARVGCKQICQFMSFTNICFGGLIAPLLAVKPQNTMPNPKTSFVLSCIISRYITVSCVCYIWWRLLTMCFLPERLVHKNWSDHQWGSRSKTGPFQPLYSTSLVWTPLHWIVLRHLEVWWPRTTHTLPIILPF